MAWLVAGLAAVAQTDSSTVKPKKQRRVELYGEVYDSFTKAKVKAFVTLMRSDSTVVDTTTCYTWGTNSFFEFKVPAAAADYILRASAGGYQDTCMAYQLRHIARNNSFRLPRMLIKKRQDSADDVVGESELGGVTVRGTRVRIAYRGDTLVYNASAFNMPEGSMLDGLIRQMPGAELKENGDIYINGRKIDYLTLNGKDFFKGQNKVMLDNLPYFTVKELKVYDKSTRQSELLGQDVEKKDYVMDVQLKREYNRGVMANAEAGAGTDSRYMGRLFSLYYDDHSRASVFGNANNVNESRQPGGEGEWRPSNMPQGLRATKQAGMHIETEDKEKRWEEELDATVEWSDADNLQRTATERFATGGNIFGGSTAQSRQKDFRFSAGNQFVLKKPFTMMTSLHADYNNGHRSTAGSDSTWRSALINRTLSDGRNDYRTLNLQGSLNAWKKFDWGDYLGITASGSISHSKPADNFSRTATYYAQNDTTALRHYYSDTHGDSFEVETRASYLLQLLNRWYIDTNVRYKHSHADGNNNYYRLDHVKDYVAASPLTCLPSNDVALAAALDGDNSDTQTHSTNSTQASISLHHSDDDQFFSVQLTAEHTGERLHYRSLQLDTVARRSYTHWSPSLGWYRWGVKKGLNQLSYHMNVSQPELLSLLPTDDTTNPLVTHINNPQLRSTITHSADISFQFNNDSTRCFLRMWGNASLTQRAIGTQTTFNTATGAYTFMQDNIDGNWNASVGMSYNRPIDKHKRLTLQQRANADYVHSVDFAVAYEANKSYKSYKTYRPYKTYKPYMPHEPQKSTVHNWLLHEKLSAEYQRDKLTVGIGGEVTWRRTTSRRDDFENISAFDYNYGAKLRYTIPLVKLSVATDIRMYSRSGYNSPMMNTDDLVWNAELSRTILKERLTLKLTAFDLLHQLSSKQYSVNAQGTTETWNNCIPRYVMFTLAYKYTGKPKK